jgi:thiamine biosynthesis lipoprotein
MAIFVSTIPALAKTQREFSFQHDYILGTSLDLTLTGATSDEAHAAEDAALRTIHRLSAILNTRDPNSEISSGGTQSPSAELQSVLNAYRYWEQRTNGIIRAELNGRVDLDALGKAYIVDRAAEAARAAAPNAGSLILDIGGDIRAFGQAILGIADPSDPFDNAEPLTRVRIVNRAIATSGSYARGAHIIDPRNGVASTASSASITAADCVTANALSTALCILSPQEGLALLESVHDAEGLLVSANGRVLRSSGFRRFELTPLRRAAYAGWTNGYQVSIALTLQNPGGAGEQQGGPPPGGGFGGRGPGGFGGRGGGFGRLRNPYVAIWAEDSSGKVVRNIALWASKPRWLNELHTWWNKNGSAVNRVSQMARATRAAGKYNVSWNGMNDAGEPVPSGTYRIWIETNREHGTHYQESVTIECGAKPSSATMKPTPECVDVQVEFGPSASGVV